MTFKQLLDAAQEADEALLVATDDLERAKAELEAVTADLEKAQCKAQEAHAAIASRLKDRGHHSTYDKTGGMTVYHADEKAPNGWASYQPIPGDASL